jgi:hypothetical protein
MGIVLVERNRRACIGEETGLVTGTTRIDRGLELCRLYGLYRLDFWSEHLERVCFPPR